MGRPLLKGMYGQFSPNFDGYQGQHLAIAIYWEPRGGESRLKNGHAALIIDFDEWLGSVNADRNSLLDGWMVDMQWYVSWLGGKIDWAPKLGSKGGAKGVANDFGSDAMQWGGASADPRSAIFKNLSWPTRWVAIRGLNANDMRDEWNAQLNKGGGAHWRLTDKNCATMVHKILKAGGGDAAATAHKRQIIWWPTDIPKYARAMTQNGVSVFAHSNDAGAVVV